MSLEDNAFNLKLYYGFRMVSAAQERVHQSSVKFREETNFHWFHIATPELSLHHGSKWVACGLFSEES